MSYKTRYGDEFWRDDGRDHGDDAENFDSVAEPDDGEDPGSNWTWVTRLPPYPAVPAYIDDDPVQVPANFWLLNLMLAVAIIFGSIWLVAQFMEAS